MATRLDYALPIARQLLRSTGRRLRPGGLAASLPGPAEGRHFVIVTGAGRSGTSAVARVLHESGFRMGTEFDQPSEFNLVGFYEDAGVRSINQQILGELGLSGIELSRKWPWRSAVLAVAERYQEEMKDLASGPVDGWKDPLFSVTLEAWLQHLPRRPKVILCLRSPEAFEHSLTRIYGLLHRQVIERWWANHLRRILDIVRDYRLEATAVSYDELVQRREETVGALSSFVGQPLDATYVEPGLRHYTYVVPRRYAALYERARALGARETGAGGSTSATPSLLARLKKRGRLTDDEARAIAGYLEHIRAIDTHVAAARADWDDALGSPTPNVVQDRGLGSRTSQVLGETHSASAEYAEALSDAQGELGSLLPPAAFERYHELTRTYVDQQRLVAHLMLKASESPQPEPSALDDAIKAWRLLSSPEATAAAEKRRSRAYERGLTKSGLRSLQQEMSHSRSRRDSQS